MRDKLPHDRYKAGLVAIGRNEGERFRACLASLPPGIPAIYVDSGSTDSSVAHAEAAGMQVVHLCIELGFTAARARNAGWRALLERHPDLRFIQFLDGDCTLDPSWLAQSLEAIEAQDRFAVVFGELRERFPERSIYNAMCDREWNVASGEVLACGGNALIRVAALAQAGGYNEKLIAGEEPDLCLRMRARGWRIHRIPPKMAMHDAAIVDFRSWWKRAIRAGYAYAEHVAIHRRAADPNWIRAVASMAFWALLLPGLVVLGLVSAVFGDAVWLLLSFITALIFILQFFRLSNKGRATGLCNKDARGEAILFLLVKFAHCAGAARFLINRLRGREAVLIEYK